MIRKKFEFKLKFAWLAVFLTGMSFFSFGQRILTIEQALEIAEDNNPSMIASKLSLQRTQFNLDAQYAGLKPNFRFTVNPLTYGIGRTFDNYNAAWYTSKELSSSGTFRGDMTFLATDATLRFDDTFSWQNKESEKATGTTVNKAFSNRLSLTLNQPLFTYNRTKMTIQGLEFDKENAGISYALQRLTQEQRITRQFYSVYSAKRTLDIRRAELENAENNYEIIKAKVEAQLMAEQELLQAQVSLMNARSSVKQSEVSLQDAKDNLKQMLGMPLNEDIDVEVTIDATPMLINIENAIQQGMGSRMELRQREISMIDADLQMIRTKANNEFNGNVSLSVGIDGDNEQFGNIYEKTTPSPKVSLSFTIPVFDWGQKRAQINAQKVSQTVAKLNYDNEVVSIELEIRSSVRSLENYRSELEIQELTIQGAQRTYALNEVLYREGDINGLQLSQYQAQFSSAQLNYVRAQINYKQELLNLKILTLYDYENDKPIVPVRELIGVSMK